MRPGSFDRLVLDQAEFWVDGQATICRIVELTTPHLRRIISFLERRAEHLHASAVLDALEELVLADASGGVSTERLTWELPGRSIADVEPATWLETTTLVRALRGELAKRIDA